MGRGQLPIVVLGEWNQSLRTRGRLHELQLRCNQATHAGGNFVVAAVDITRLADGVPTLKTDWWNYGGLTRAVSLIEVPEAFIDQYDIHLLSPEHHHFSARFILPISTAVHVIGGNAGDKVQVEIPELKSTASGVLSADGRAQIHLVASNLERWSPETPKVYKVRITAGQDTIEDLIGFRTVETRGTEILLNGKPIFLRGVAIHAEAPYHSGRATRQGCGDLLGWAKNWVVTTSAWRTIPTMKPCCAQPIAWDYWCGRRIPSIGPSSLTTQRYGQGRAAAG